MKLFKTSIFWLIIITLVGLIFRLYKIDNPVADWHAWRQADTAAVSRVFYQEGYDPFIPKYYDMSGVAEKPVANPQRYRFVEFPIYNSLVYFAYLLKGGVDERLARLISILFSLGSLIFLYLITKKVFGQATAFIAAALYTALPFNVYFSRAILPEPTFVFFCLAMFYFVNRWILEDKPLLFYLSIFFTTCAFLTKPMAIFYLLPLLLTFHQKQGKWWPIPIRYWCFLISSLLPLLIWRIWIGMHPEGIPASNWLFDGNHLRLKPAFFRWIVGDRFGREILGVAGTFLFLIGLLVKPKVKDGLLLHFLAVFALLYLVIVATGNVQHDYYQYMIVPALVIFVARGFLALLEGISAFLPRIFIIPLAFLLLILTIYLPWTEVKGLYQINNPVIVEAGKAADKVLPKDAMVIAPYNGDTSFLYYVNRPGFPVMALPVEKLIAKFNTQYLVSVNRDNDTNYALKKYTAIVDNPKYVIVDLTRINPEYK